MIMVKKKIINLLSLLFLFLIGCTEEDELGTWTRPAEYTTITQLIEESVLLKDIQESADEYTFVFETQTLALPSSDVQSIEKDVEHWTTTLTFPDNSVLEIPTLGTSIESFIAYATVNPSGFNPLAAEVRLNLPQGGRIQTIVHTKEGYQTPNIEHTTAFSSYKTQFITILGLYADYNNQVEIVYQDKEGNERGRTTLDIQTEALTLNNLPHFKVVKAAVDKMEPGLTLVNSAGKNEDDTSRPYMVDADGEIRWILDWRESKELVHIGAQCGLHRLPNGNYVTGDFNNNQLVEVDVLGNLVQRWDLVALGYSYHHEVIPSQDGRYLITVTKPGATHSDGTPRILDFIIEFDPKSGTVTHEWDLSTLMDTERINKVDESIPGSASYGQSRTNWLHNNGVAEDKNAIVATGRWQGVFSYNRDNTLNWIIAPHNKWKEKYKKYLLQPLDKNGQPITDEAVLNGEKAHPDFEWTWGVHCPNVLPNGHILVFDNGYCRNFIPRLLDEPDSYSRIVEYEINETNRTIKQVWQYGKERGRACYASAISGVQYLPQTDNRLFCPGQDNQLSENGIGGRIIEINPETNEVVFELEIETNTCSSAFHRANRISLYPENE